MKIAKPGMLNALRVKRNLDIKIRCGPFSTWQINQKRGYKNNYFQLFSCKQFGSGLANDTIIEL